MKAANNEHHAIGAARELHEISKAATNTQHRISALVGCGIIHALLVISDVIFEATIGKDASKIK